MSGAAATRRESGRAASHGSAEDQRGISRDAGEPSPGGTGATDRRAGADDRPTTTAGWPGSAEPAATGTGEHPPRRAETALRDALQKLSLVRPREGYRPITARLRQQGWVVNHKRVE